MARLPGLADGLAELLSASWLERCSAQRKRNLLWQLSRKRFMQVGVEMLFVSGVLVFSGRCSAAVEALAGAGLDVPARARVRILDAAGARGRGAAGGDLAQLLRAVALLYAEVSTAGITGRQARPIVETGLKAVAGRRFSCGYRAVLPLRRRRAGCCSRAL